MVHERQGQAEERLGAGATEHGVRGEAVAEVGMPNGMAIPDRPLLLGDNRVRRGYRGGALLEAFVQGAGAAVGAAAVGTEAQGAGIGPGGSLAPPNAADGERPEDWTASLVRSRYAGTLAPPDEGIGHVLGPAGQAASLEAVARAWPEALFGAGRGPEHVPLVKLLDAAIRLPVHCHPTDDFARTRLGQPRGKTEAWVILAVRGNGDRDPDADCIYLGLKADTTLGRFRAAIAERRFADVKAQLHRFAVRPGDVYFVPPGVPHAIGAGLFMVEVQQPADASIPAEPFPGDPPWPPEGPPLPIPFKAALEAFSATPLSRDAAEAQYRCLSHPLRLTPEAESNGAAWREWVGARHTQHFRVIEAVLGEPAPWPFAGEAAVVVVLAGHGSLAVEEGQSRAQAGVRPASLVMLPLRTGQRWLVPAGTHPVTVRPDGELRLLVCLGPT